MHSAIALFALPFPDPFPGHSHRLRLAQRRLDQEGEKGFVFGEAWAQRMVLRRRALDSRMVSAVADMKVVLDMNHWSRLFAGQRTPLAAQEVLRRQGYGCETVDCSQLRNVAGTL